MKPGVLPAWEVWIGDWRVTVRVDLEDKVEIEPPAPDGDGRQMWHLLENMTPDEAMNLAEALTLAAQATQERR